MSLHDRIKEARIKKGLTQEQLGELVGVAKTTITGYEKNREPTAAKTGEIADALGVDVNFLYQDEVKQRKENNVSLEEFSIVKKFRSLDDIGKNYIIYELDRETKRMEELQKQSDYIQTLKNSNIEDKLSIVDMRQINYYYRVASAGTGQIIFDLPPTKRIDIPNIPKYRKADYAIGVNGNSMEPLYYDGDTLLIEMTEEIEIGDIGIFRIDNESYVKKLGKTELISLNPNANNVPLNESAGCMGKVIGKLSK